MRMLAALIIALLMGLGVGYVARTINAAAMAKAAAVMELAR